ncbi:MAG TPA: molybdopterin-guanine dinucleotide biosynthesis protein B [Peptococcaceae bacterium]|jgi:molybdopterin-guanine dinucleotide biosynthesis protein B|nr:molybdopterin-guanine dinucleotide biosynthesis protein B [Peptococcaceae bacterium]
MIPVIFISGYSNTGKTTLVKNLIQSFKEMGYRVAAVKHAVHGYELDVQGRDTWHYCQAGADQVVVVGPGSLTRHQLYAQEPPFQEVLEMIEDVDLIIVEGFKKEAGPKVEVIRKGKERLPLGNDLIAVVSDEPLTQKVPCFANNDVDQLAKFIIDYFSL